MLKQTVIPADEFFIGQLNDAVVTTTLRSVSHQADPSDQVTNNFEVMLIVNGAGETLQYQDQLNLLPGTTQQVSQVANHFTYEDTSCLVLKSRSLIFTAMVITDLGTAVFQGNAKGKLKPGTSHFRIPLVLENGNRKSTIVLRGTIHTSCSSNS